jgi:hypothetical protein
MFLPITLTIGGACALLSIWLAIRVSHVRRLNSVSIGDGGNAVVATRMRAHANFAEYTPIFLILLAAVELAVGANMWLWGIAILFVLSRLAHPFGMDRPAPNALRMAGVALTWLALLALGVWAVTLGYTQDGATGQRRDATVISA